MAKRDLATRPLVRLGWRGLRKHPLQSLLMVLGITLGVAVVVAIDLANASASRAFDLSVDSIAGRATHTIVGGPGGLDENVYSTLRQRGIVDAAAPVITEYVSSPELGGTTLRLLGIDPFADPPFRSYLDGGGRIPLEQLTAFLTGTNAILLSSELASRYRLNSGDVIHLVVGGRPEEAVIAGLLDPRDEFSRRALQGLILTDVASAQEMTGRLGRLDQIDLILPENSKSLEARISALLPQDARIVPVGARTGTVAEMTAAFRINLTALSLLALLVGVFLIYNTMTFSVVQRRPMLGTLRCLGVTRREVFLMVVTEALIVGMLGSAAGIGLGIVLGQGAVRMVTQTINDLYFAVTVRSVQIPAWSLIKGAALGTVATVVAAAPPAWEAASVQPRAALSRSGLESKAQKAVIGTAVGGLVLIGIGVGTLLWPTRDLVVSFAGTFAVIVGVAMLTPAVMQIGMKLAGPLTGKLWGALGRMAPRNVINSLSRTAIAVAALMVAVAVTIGVGVMIGSFRNTVVVWLTQTLQGDIYISVPGGTASSPSTPIDPRVLTTLQGWPGIARIDTLRATTIDSPDGPIDVSAFENPDDPSETLYYSRDIPVENMWEAMQGGGVVVSEPLARRLGLPMHGGHIVLYTDAGTHEFPILGIFYDYASSQGTVLMAQNVYRSLWDDDTITAIALRLEPGQDVDAVAADLREAFAPIQQMSVNPNQALRANVLAIFDRTFAITGALQMLATIVAFIGVLSALLSLQLEKQRELGILRAVGLTTRQLWQLVLLETGLMGTVAGILAMPTGYVLALILVYIINRRAFGWTLQMQILPMPFLTALIVAVIAALLAGIYPAWRMSRMITADAIRFE